MRRWAMGVCFLLGLLAACGVAAYAGGAERDPAVRSLLRLGDLGPGYVTDDDSGCGAPDSEGASRRLLRFNDDHRDYHVCEVEFDELWRPADAGPRPRTATSVAIHFPRAADARDASRIAPEFAHYHLGVSARSLRRIATRRAAGAALRIYRTADALVDDVPRRPAIVVMWRTGRTLSLVLRSGGSATAQADATRLAAIQQGRILHPSPVPAHANDDRFVSLDNPAIDYPIPWLGPRFRAPGLPELKFAEGEAGDGAAPGSGGSASIDYAAPVRKNPYSGVALGIWRPAAWAKFTRSRAGRLVWSARCTRSTRVALPTGYADVYAGHTRHQRRCGRRPDRFLAHVYLPGVVVSVNQPTCLSCVDRGRGPDPWDSMRGMRAIVEGLTIRRRG